MLYTQRESDKQKVKGILCDQPKDKDKPHVSIKYIHRLEYFNIFI